MPEGRTKDKLLILIIFLLLGGLFGIVAYELSRPKQKQKNTIVETIKVLRDTVYAYKPSHYKDTFTQLEFRYRVRTDSIRIWLNSNNNWDSICKKVGKEADSLGCRSLLLHSYYKSQYLDTVIRIYQAQRTEDSLQIGMMFKLDSMTSELIKQKDGEIVQAKRESRRKVAKNAFVGGLLGFIVGIILK